MRTKHLLFLAISAGLFSVSPAWSEPVVNTAGDGFEDVGGDAYAYYQNTGEFMFFGGEPGTGNFNNPQDFADGSLELMVEDWLGIADSSLFSLTEATEVTSTNPNEASGTWSTNSSDLLSFYVVKAANNYAMYYVNPAESTGSWSTYDLWFAGYGGNEGLEISHFTGYNSTETPAPIPEPATMLLLGTGLAGLVGLRRRRK